METNVSYQHHLDALISGMFLKSLEIVRTLGIFWFKKQALHLKLMKLETILSHVVFTF